MDKEEILRRSREEGKDEWEEQVNKDITIREKRWVTPLVVLASILFASHGFTENWVPYALMILLCVPTVVYQIYGYVKTKKAEHLVVAGLVIFAIILLADEVYNCINGWM